MTTIVKNLMTQEEALYTNNQSLTDNLINFILFKQKKTSLLLDEKARNEVRPLIEEKTSKLTGRKFAFCLEYDLHASEQINSSERV